MLIKIIVIGLLFLPVICVANEDVPLRMFDPMLDIGGAHPVLNNELKIDGYEYLVATLGSENKGAKISWAPFMERNTYNNWLSETRFEVSQSDGISSIGASIKYNPFNPKSTYAQTQFKNIVKDFQSPDSMGVISSVNLRIEALEQAKVDVLVGGHTNTCQYNSASLKPQSESVVKDLNDILSNWSVDRIDEFEKRTDYYYCIYANTADEINNNKDKFNANQKTIFNLRQNGGANNQDAVNLLLSKNEKISAEIQAMEANQNILGKLLEPVYWRLINHSSNPPDTLPSALIVIEQEIKSLREKIVSLNDVYDSKFYLHLKQALLDTFLPVISLSYKSDYFKVLSGDSIDSDDDGFEDNFHNSKKTSLTLSTDWRLSEDFSMSLLYGESSERESAQQDKVKIDYENYGATVVYKLFTLNEDGYKENKDYKESLFEPTVSLGFAFEKRKCRASNKTLCIDKKVSEHAITPFIDVKLSTSTQFRFGVSFRDDESITTEDDIDTIQALASINILMKEPG